MEWARYQKPLGDAASVIETEFDDDYALAYFGPSRTFTIGFAGDAPVGAITLLDETGLPPVTIRRAAGREWPPSARRRSARHSP